MEKAHSGINILLYLPDMQFIWANLCAMLDRTAWTESISSDESWSSQF